MGSAAVASQLRAASVSTSPSSRPASGTTSTTSSWFLVRVPVLSKQNVSMEAASSTASRRVTSTPSRASARALAAWTMASTAGSATGTAPMRKVTTIAATESSSWPRASA